GSGVWKFFWKYVVAQAHLIPGNAKFVRADINHAFQKPKVLHPRVATIRSDRALVRHRLREINANVFQAIDTWYHLCPNHTAERFVTRISSTVVIVMRIDPGNYSVLVERDPSIAEGA